MPERPSGGGGGSRLSPQTLIIASLASLTAAIVTSTFWRRGTPITAAVTPVIVALASELYSRPARRISEYRAATRATPSRFQRERSHVPAGGPPPRRPDRGRITEPTAAGPIRIYRSEGAQRRRRVRLQAAVLTAGIAFLIAVVVLTVPELLFGGSVASSGSTTFFGGGGKHHSAPKQEKPATKQGGSSSQSQTTTQPPPSTQTAPQSTTPTQTPTAPSSGTPAPAPQQQQPHATPPSQTPPGQ